MNIFLITLPIICISSKVNLSPLAKLHGAQEGATFPFMCGRLLSILSSPIGSSVVPQCTQGFKIRSRTSSVVRSHSSMRWYAFLRYIARPLSVRPYRLFLSLAISLCAGVMLDHCSFLRSRPRFLSEWHALHSYASPSRRDESRKNISGFAGSSCSHRLQILKPSAEAVLYFLVISGLYHKWYSVKCGPHFELDRKVYP